MSKKAKKRKSRRLSSSSSEDDKKTSKKRKETTKRKHVSSKEKKDGSTVQKTRDHSSSKEKKDVTVQKRIGHSSSKEKKDIRAQKTRDHSSSKERKDVSTVQKTTNPSSRKEKKDVTVQKTTEPSSSKEDAQSKRQIKKPMYKLEKTEPTREQSPIFKEEESAHKAKPSVGHGTELFAKSKDSENSSPKGLWIASFSEVTLPKDMLIPRSVSIGHKAEKQRPTTKRRWDVSPQTDSLKAKEAKKPSLVCKDAPTHQRNEPVKQIHHHLEEKSLRDIVKRKLLADVASKRTTTATISSKTKAVSAPQPKRVTEKKCAIVPPQLPSQTKTVVAEKAALERISFPIKSDHKPASGEAKSSCIVEPSLRQSKNKIPAAVTYKKTTTASTSRAKTTKALPEPHENKCATVPPQSLSTLLSFRIPKKIAVPDISSAKDNTSLPVKGSHAKTTCEASTSVPQSRSSTVASSNLDVQKQDLWPSFADNVLLADSLPQQNQIMVVKELHQARSEKLLEVNVMQSYGELTCMEIDPPEEGAANTRCTELPQQDVIIVLDTNILLSHLNYVKKIVSRGLEVVFPVVLVPWVVLQELDSLKKGRGLSGSVASSAIPAISYIYNCLKGKESRLWGQSMQQAAESTNGLNAENNDDRVLQCCLQYQLLYPGCAVILCTNDKNLCSKALLSGVKAFSKIDLETEVARSSQCIPFLQAAIRPPDRNSISTLTPSKGHAQAETQSQEITSLSVEQENNEPQEAKSGRSSGHLSSLLCQFESVLQGALSGVLEAEMKAAFEDLWLEIVYKKPPWSLSDALECLKKHWIAVFGHVVPRDKHQNVLNLTEFFTSGKSVDHESTVVALLEAKDLLKEFVKSSSHVPSAISAVDNILNSLQTQGETSGSDVVMKEAEEDKQPTSPPVSHAEVWALFGNIWEHVYQTSMEVFKAVDFDPKASQRVRPLGGPPPPQDALACLHKLLCLVSQLLQAFRSFLASSALAEAQDLLCVIQSTEMVNVDKVTAADLLHCFSQEEYRERMRMGGRQLLEVQAVLSSCVEFTGGQVPFSVQP